MLDCEFRDPVLVEIRSESFYGHPFPSAVSIRAAISFLRKRGHSKYWLTMEQCRSVNRFMPTGVRVFNPFKFTDRSVIIMIIGSLVFLTPVIFIILLKSLYHLSKQCRPLSDIISFTICLVFTLDLHCSSNSFIWVLGIIGLTDCVQIMSKCLLCMRWRFTHQSTIFQSYWDVSYFLG